MKVFQVYHRKELMYRYSEADEMATFNRDDYDWVAGLDAEDLGDVFRLTNHIDHAWWENPEIKYYKESRSTSVGDVVRDVEAGTYHLCMPTGWKELKRSRSKQKEEELKAEVMSQTYFPVCEDCEHPAYDYETGQGCYHTCKLFRECGEKFLEDLDEFCKFIEEEKERQRKTNELCPF